MKIRRIGTCAGMSAILLRCNYADRVEWAIVNLVDLRPHTPPGSDGEQTGYPRQTVTRAAGAVTAAHYPHEEDHADPRAH